MGLPLHQALRTRLAACALAGLATFASPLLHATPQPGWWWNPGEAGRGFFIEVQGPNMFMGGYFYGPDGSPVWLASNGPMPQADAYDGRLDAYSGGQSLLGAYRPPSAPADAGAVSLRFSDDTHGTLTWPGGTVPIERFDFQHGAAPAFQPRTGWWWNPDESGRGFSVEIQGDHMFLGAYMYDDSGNPVWYVADAAMQSSTRFSGPLLRYANGQTLTGGYHPPTAPASIGAITVDFSATDRATVTLSDDVPQLAAKAARAFPIKPLFEKPAAATAVPHWVGNMLQVINSVSDVGEVSTWRAEVVSMTWELDELQGLDGGYPIQYRIRPGSFVVADIQLDSPTCSGRGAASADLAPGELALYRDGSYSGKVFQQVMVHGKETCRIDDHNVLTFDIDIPVPLSIALSGRIDTDGAMRGSTRTDGVGAVTNRTWSFQPRP